MSRTTNTTPRRVQLAQDPAKRRAVHEHSFHVCDLPSTPSALKPRRRRMYPYQAYWTERPCHFEAARSCVSLRWHYDCDCDWCSGGHTRARVLRRQARDIMSGLVNRCVAEELLDEIDDKATPRR